VKEREREAAAAVVDNNSHGAKLEDNEIE